MPPGWRSLPQKESPLVSQSSMNPLPTSDIAVANDQHRFLRVLGAPVWGVACSLALLGAILLAHPYAELGLSDDFSFVRTAQVLAQTGHIQYNGWSAPILGWQLYLAAIFIKFFGFSFTVTRASVMSVSVATAFLCQRTFVRAGIHEWNASIGTLTLMLSPLCMPLEVTFLSDMPGLFAIVSCCYACLRALEAKTPNRALAWVAVAALSNVVLGSARQVGWLGVLVMVPSALWLLRKDRRVFIPGSGLWVLGSALVFAILHWFERQPYAVSESLLPHRIGWHVLRRLVEHILRTGFEAVLLLLPVMLMFLPVLRRRSFPKAVYAVGGLFLVSAVWLWGRHQIVSWFAPYLPGVAPFSDLRLTRAGLTLAVLLSILALLASVLTRKNARQDPADSPCSISDRTLAVLLLPFAISYTSLLLPRAGFGSFWDRYVIPLLFVFLIFLLRYWQKYFSPRLPLAALILAVGLGLYASAVLHDDFAYNRARIAAIDEVLASGVPATAVSGGWDYDGWTELQFSDHIVGPGMNVPPGVTLPKPTHYGLAHCPWFYCDMYPHVVPHYTISLHPDPIPGANFAPVPYHSWIGPSGTFYVVRFPDRSADGPV